MQTASVLYRPQYTPSQRRDAAAFQAARARLTRVPAEPQPLPPSTEGYNSVLGIETMEIWALSLPDVLTEEYQPWFWMVPLSPPIPVRPKIEIIQRVVATQYGISVADMLSARRTADVVLPRHIAMFVAKRMTGRSLPEIGRKFGMRDHTSVLSAIRKIGRMVDARTISLGSIVELECLVMGVT